MDASQIVFDLWIMGKINKKTKNRKILSKNRKTSGWMMFPSCVFLFLLIVLLPDKGRMRRCKKENVMNSEVGKDIAVECMSGRFIDPMTDVGFKVLFGSEGGKCFLAGFLGALLREKIVIEEFLDKEISPETGMGKRTVFDIMCKDRRGHRFLVEMQVRKQSHYMQRLLYYMGRCVTGQLKRGGEYSDIRPVIGIFIMGFEPDDGMDGLIMDMGASVAYNDLQHPLQGCMNDYILSDRLGGGADYEGFRQIYIRLARFRKSEAECRDMIDKWIYILKNMKWLNEIPFKDQEEMFRRLEEYADASNMDPEERIAYDLYVDSLRSYDRGIEYERKLAREEAWKEAWKEAREEAWKEAEESVREAGMRGERQGIEKTARRMLSMGMDRGIIASATGLSPEHIAGLSPA